MYCLLRQTNQWHITVLSTAPGGAWFPSRQESKACCSKTMVKTRKRDILVTENYCWRSSPQLLRQARSLEQVPEIPHGPPHRFPTALAQTGQHPQTSCTYWPLSQQAGICREPEGKRFKARPIRYYTFHWQNCLPSVCQEDVLGVILCTYIF